MTDTSVTPRSPPVFTTDFTDRTDHASDCLSYPCHPCNPWFLLRPALSRPAPDAVLAPFGFPPALDFWPRVTGVLVLCLATYSLVAARANLTALIRAKMVVTEDKQYSRDYLDPEKRSIANAVQVFFRDGTKTERIEVHYPLGHRRRRKEGIPVLQQKAHAAFTAHYGAERAAHLMSL